MIPDAAGRMHLTDLDKYDASVIPLFVAEKDMRFYLYTRKAWREEIKMDVRSIRASSFNRNHPTRLTIHGWNGDETSAVNSRVIEEYLKLGDFNCIMVDWSQGSGNSMSLLNTKALTMFSCQRNARLYRCQVPNNWRCKAHRGLPRFYASKQAAALSDSPHRWAFTRVCKIFPQLGRDY